METFDKRRVDLVIRHARVVTIDRNRTIFANGAVAVDAGLIVAVGPDQQVASHVEGREERDAAGGVVHPGLVDAHVHLGGELLRGFTPKASGAWGSGKRQLFESASPEVEYLGSLLPCMEMVASGTTLYADTGGSFDLTATVRAIETVGLRGMPSYWLADDPSAAETGRHYLSADEVAPIAAPTEQCIERLEAQLTTFPFASERRVRCAATSTGMGLSSDRLLTATRRLADAHGTPMILHVGWDPRETALSMEAHGRRPVEHLDDLGVLRADTTLVHAIDLSDEDIDLVFRAGAAAVLCPNVSMRRGQGALRTGKFPEMAERGITIALGSDGLTSKHDVLRQAFLAATALREIRGEQPVFTGEAVLEMATIGGAKALGMASEVGSIEVGKRADLVLHGVDRPESHPRFDDPVDSLVFYGQSATIDTVYVDGEAILDRGRFTRFDAAAALSAIDEAAAVLARRVASPGHRMWPVVGTAATN